MQGHRDSENRGLHEDAAPYGHPILDITAMPHIPTLRNGRYGSSGTPVEVLVNYFYTNVHLPNLICRYDLSFTKLPLEDPRSYSRSYSHSYSRSRGRGRNRRERPRVPTSDAKPPPLPVCVKLIRDIEVKFPEQLKNTKIAHEGQKNV